MTLYGGRWTQYVYYDFYRLFHFFLNAGLQYLTRFCQKVYDETNHFTSPDPIEVCRKHVDYEIVRSFLEWSCSDLEIQKGVVSLYPRESLEDGHHPIHTRSGGSCSQDGHEKCT